MPLSDSSGTCMRAVWPEPSPAVLRLGFAAGVSEVSRFSCMKFLGVLWGLRLRRTDQRLAISPLLMLPSAHLNCVGVLIASFRSSIPRPPIPLFTLRCAPRDAQRKTRGRVDRYSFLVGILPPLLHAGLSRRTEIRKLPPEVWPMIRFHWSNPKSFEGIAQYLEALPESAAAVASDVGVRGTLRDVPLIVLSAEK